MMILVCPLVRCQAFHGLCSFSIFFNGIDERLCSNSNALPADLPGGVTHFVGPNIQYNLKDKICN